MRFLAGLIGSGIASSGSPAIHEREARQLGIQLFYQLMDLKRAGTSPEPLRRLLEAAELAGFAGVNITHPCKQAVIPLVDGVSAEADAIGAVNTVVFRNGKRIGHNTDGFGFSENVRCGMPDADLESVLVVGAGGGGSAVCYALLRMGARKVLVFDRVRECAEKLVRRLSERFDGGCVSLLEHPAEAIQSVSGVVHATPVGMIGHPGMPIAREWLRPDLWVADIVYFPLETELIKAARERGCRTLDGGGMAVFQAAEAFRLFTGVEPDRARMLAQFRGS